MTSKSDSHDVLSDSNARQAARLAGDATCSDPRRRTESARGLGTIKYDNERAARHKDSRNPHERGWYDMSRATLPIADAFIATADVDQLRHVLEGMVHGLNIHILLSERRPDGESDLGQAPALERHADDVVRVEPAASPLSAMFLSDVAAAFTQTDDVDARHRAGIYVGMLKHRDERVVRTWEHTSNADDVRAGDARRSLVTIDGLIDDADADQLRDIIDGIAISTRA